MILLWSSATSTARLVLLDNGNPKIEYEWEAGRSLAKEMLSYLRDKLAENSKTFEDVTGIGVMKGPGSFTGLRIGIVVLNTLSDSLSIPIVGVSGVDWENIATERLLNGDNDQLVLPAYGTDAHITLPKK